MKMLSPWIENAFGHAIRVFHGADQNDQDNYAVQVLAGIPSVRIRASTGTHPDELNWAEGETNQDNKSWCDRMARSFGYTLPEDGVFVIQYADGAFNIGPEGSEVNGFPSALADASRYATMEAAQEKLRDLLYSDGTGARVVRVRDLGTNISVIEENV